MKSVQRIVSSLLVVALTGLAAAGCTSKPSEPATPAKSDPSQPGAGQPPLTPATVKVGNVSSLLFAPLYVAQEKGYFAEQQLTVQLETIQAGQDAMVFLAQGQLDFVLAGYSAALFNAVDRGMDLRVIAPMGIQPKQGDPSPLMVRADLVKSGEVKSVKDLKGKKIAVLGGMGATGSYLAARRLEKVGLTLADVELVNVAAQDQEAALANKAVDAAIMNEPYSSKAIGERIGLTVDVGALAGTNASGLLTSGTMLKDKSDVVVRFTTALMKAARDIQGDNFKSDEHINAFAKYTKMQPDQLRTVTPYAFDPNFSIEIPKQDLASLQEIMSKAGILKLKSPVDIGHVTDGAPAAAAAKQLGAK